MRALHVFVFRTRITRHVIITRRIHMAKLMIKNIGTLVSGNISNPLLNADTLIIEGGLIQACW